MTSPWEKLSIGNISERALSELSYIEFEDPGMKKNIFEFSQKNPKLFQILTKIAYEMSEAKRLSSSQSASYEDLVKYATKLVLLIQLANEDLDN